MLTYDDSTHSYAIDGQPAPGITRVLGDLGYHGNAAAFYTELSRRRGKAVHMACQLADEICPAATTLGAVLDRVEISENLHPYLNGYLLFKRETGFVPELHEVPVCHRGLRIAGTPDKWGYIGGTPVLVDLKSWRSQGIRPKRSAEIQVSAYSIMLQEHMGHKSERLIVLKLAGDGKYRMYEIPRPELIIPIVWGCASVWWDLNNHGLLPNQQTADDESTAAVE